MDHKEKQRQHWELVQERQGDNGGLHPVIARNRAVRQIRRRRQRRQSKEADARAFFFGESEEKQERSQETGQHSLATRSEAENKTPGVLPNIQHKAATEEKNDLALATNASSSQGKIEPHGHSKYSYRLWNFDVGESRLKAEHKAKLRDTLQALSKEAPDIAPHTWTVGILGYASVEGSEKANDTLSQERASAVWDFIDVGQNLTDIINESEEAYFPAGGVVGLGEVSQFGEEYPRNRAVEVLIDDPSAQAKKPFPKGVTFDQRKAIANTYDPDDTTKLEHSVPEDTAAKVGNPEWVDSVGDGVDDWAGGFFDVMGLLDVANTVASVTEAFKHGAIAGGGLSLLGIVGFAYTSFSEFTKATESADIAAECIGASYAIVYWAHELKTQPAMNAERYTPSFFDEAFRSTLRSLEKLKELERAKYRAEIKKLSPVQALNQVYQELITKLEDTFLKYIPAGGVAYELHKKTHLTWPDFT